MSWIEIVAVVFSVVTIISCVPAPTSTGIAAREIFVGVIWVAFLSFVIGVKIGGL